MRQGKTRSVHVVLPLFCRSVNLFIGRFHPIPPIDSATVLPLFCHYSALPFCLHSAVFHPSSAKVLPLCRCSDATLPLFCHDSAASAGARGATTERWQRAAVRRPAAGSFTRPPAPRERPRGHGTGGGGPGGYGTGVGRGAAAWLGDVGRSRPGRGGHVPGRGADHDPACAAELWPAGPR